MKADERFNVVKAFKDDPAGMLEKVFEEIKAGKSYSVIAEEWDVDYGKLKNFVYSPRHGDKLREFTRSRAKNWYIAGCKAKTLRFAKGRLEKGFTRREIAEELFNRTGVKVEPHNISILLQSEIKNEVETTQDEINRLYSIHIIGANPETLARYSV